MGRQIIQQPDGLFCIWSTVSDSIVVTDATEKELVKMARRDAANEAERRVREAIKAVCEGRARDVYYQFAMTYEEARSWGMEDDDA